jgi:2-amino-4-hydroxy-6-hydroxymethyldihydropteridine diphosphokinase
MNTAIIMLGSNFNRDEMLALAKEKLSNLFEIIDESKILDTEPVGKKFGNNYLNQALKITSDNALKATIKSFKQIETDLGRNRQSESRGETPIDIDLIFWNEKIQKDDYKKYWFVKELIDQIKDSSNYSDV